MSVPEGGRSRARRRVLLGALVAGVLALVPFSGTYAAFTGQTSNPTNSVTAAQDWLAPVVSAGPVLLRTGGSVPGYVRPGHGYRIYTSAADAPGSNPTSGLSTVTSNSTFMTATATAHPMTATAATVGGTAYSHQSTTELTVAAGTAVSTTVTRPISVTATDNAAPTKNSTTVTATNVIVESTAPVATTLAVANGAGSTAQRVDAGDTMTFTWGEQLDPYSVIAGWAGASTPVTVRIVDAGGAETLTVRNAANTADLPLGSVTLTNLNTIPNNSTITYGGPTAGTRSALAWGTATSFTVTLGTQSAAPNNRTGRGAYTWAPSNLVLDRAGNGSSTATVTGDNNDRDF